MNDLNYYPLDVESNIYGMTTLQFEDGTSKVLVATSDCQIYCINYNKFKPNPKGVEFTYIPNGAKIISIAALKRGPNDFVIGITHSLAPSLQKASARSSTSFHPASGVCDYGRLTTYYFNIYATGSILSNFDLDYVAQGCQTIRLKFVPYHLYQTEAITLVDPNNFTIKRRPFWLLSGASIHAYYEDRPYQSFNETPIEECFPELSSIPALALWIDVMNIETARGEIHSNYERVIALGFEDGSVRLYHSVMSFKTGRFELIRESSFDSYTTIIPSVRLFKISSIRPSKLRKLIKSKTSLDKSPGEQSEQINLLAVSSTNASLIFEDILNQGLDRKCELPDSQRLDCSVASAIGDTNLDGYNEILIGTHGRELITYQYDPNTRRYFLAQLSELNHPVFAVSIVDLTGDALKEVAILLSNGVLIMQATVKDVIGVCKKRVDTILSLLRT